MAIFLHKNREFLLKKLSLKLLHPLKLFFIKFFNNFFGSNSNKGRKNFLLLENFLSFFAHQLLLCNLSLMPQDYRRLSLSIHTRTVVTFYDNARVWEGCGIWRGINSRLDVIEMVNCVNGFMGGGLTWIVECSMCK